jgi:hypothetical protein
MQRAAARSTRISIDSGRDRPARQIEARAGNAGRCRGTVVSRCDTGAAATVGHPRDTKPDDNAAANDLAAQSHDKARQGRQARSLASAWEHVPHSVTTYVSATIQPTSTVRGSTSCAYRHALGSPLGKGSARSSRHRLRQYGTSVDPGDGPSGFRDVPTRSAALVGGAALCRVVLPVGGSVHAPAALFRTSAMVLSALPPAQSIRAVVLGAALRANPWVVFFTSRRHASRRGKWAARSVFHHAVPAG